MSRIVDRQMLLGDREREVLRKMIWRVADFSEVEVLTYCIMNDHFHVLIKVPEKDRPVSDAELLRRFKVLYPKPIKYQTASFADLERALREGNERTAQVRQELLARMHDLSEFMKTLKQRFSIWYNRNHDRRLGTLWMDRFKSVLVQGEGNPLQTMATYIDLNPVRAGLVEDPKDYRWCGYAEALAGAKCAQRGLRIIWSCLTDSSPRLGESASVQSALAAHRSLIFGKGVSPWLHQGKRISRAAAEKVLNDQQGALPLPVVLRCRVRYFTDGLILGSREFVRSYAEKWLPGNLCRVKKKPPSYPALGADWGDLAVFNAMRRSLFGPRIKSDLVF